LELGCLDNGGMGVAHVAHIVDTVEVLPSFIIVEVLPLSTHHVHLLIIDPYSEVRPHASSGEREAAVAA